MELQGDRSVKRLRRWIGEVHHCYAIQAGDVMIPLNDQQIFIPVLLPEHILVFHCRPDDPLPAIAIDAAGMLIGGRVDLELQSLRNIRRSRLEARMEENPAIAVAYTPEPEGKLEVFVVLCGL